MADIHFVAPIFLALFNHLFSTGNIPSSWRLSAITPIHKSGPSNIPGKLQRQGVPKFQLRFFAMVVLCVDMNTGLIVERKSMSRLSISTLVSYLHQFCHGHLLILS